MLTLIPALLALISAKFNRLRWRWKRVRAQIKRALSFPRCCLNYFQSTLILSLVSFLLLSLRKTCSFFLIILICCLHTVQLAITGASWAGLYVMRVHLQHKCNSNTEMQEISNCLRTLSSAMTDKSRM